MFLKNGAQPALVEPQFKAVFFHKPFNFAFPIFHLQRPILLQLLFVNSTVPDWLSAFAQLSRNSVGKCSHGGNAKPVWARECSGRAFMSMQIVAGPLQCAGGPWRAASATAREWHSTKTDQYLRVDRSVSCKRPTLRLRVELLSPFSAPRKVVRHAGLSVDYVPRIKGNQVEAGPETCRRRSALWSAGNPVQTP